MRKDVFSSPVGERLRAKRVTARIPGYAVARKAGINRSKLSEIENGHVRPTEAEHQRINSALDELAAAKQRIAQVAAEVGWPDGTEVVIR